VAVSFKIALRHVDFIQLIFYSSCIAVIIHLFFALIGKKFKELIKVNRRELFYSAGVGFLNPFLYYMVLLKAYTLLPAQLAQPLNYLWPVMLVLLSAPLLGQRLTGRSIIALFVGFMGVYVISTRGSLLDYHIEHPIGVILAAGSSVIWALSWIFNKKDSREADIKLFWSFFFGLIYIVIALFCFSGFVIPETEGILAILYVGFFETGITFFLWLKAIQMADRNDRIGNLVFISPILALVFIRLILKEPIFYTTYLGLGLIILSIFINQKFFKRETY
jgi:drug/metabolite transporter (DMT)-like permease